MWSLKCPLAARPPEVLLNLEQRSVIESVCKDSMWLVTGFLKSLSYQMLLFVLIEASLSDEVMGKIFFHKMWDSFFCTHEL